MKIPSMLAIVALLALALPVQADHHVQSGGHSDCLDLFVFWAAPGVYAPNAQIITTTPGQAFSVKHDSDDGLLVFIDFYDASGTFVSSNNGHANGIVPAGAVTGTICINGLLTTMTQPDVQWFYTECDSAPCPF